MTVVADAIKATFIDKTGTLTSLTSNINAVLEPDADILGELSQFLEDDPALKEQVTAFIAMLPGVNPKTLPQKFSAMLNQNKETLYKEGLIWDIVQDNVGMLMFSRGPIKSAFNLGTEVKGVAPGKVLVSNLYTGSFLEPKGFSIYKI